MDLADLYRVLGRDPEAEAVLRQALAIAPDDAAAHHALGLTLARQHRMPEALAMLAKAAALDPQQSRYAYVYAIALSATGARDKALSILEDNHLRHQADRETLAALISLNREAGDTVAARRYAEMLARLAPGNPAVARLLTELPAPGQK